MFAASLIDMPGSRLVDYLTQINCRRPEGGWFHRVRGADAMVGRGRYHPIRMVAFRDLLRRSNHSSATQGDSEVFMSIQNFSGLLEAARSQAQPQRLLLVFATAELPEDASADERTRFESGEGGALAPSMCVDKTPEEIADFAALLTESRETGVDWVILFVAAMSGRDGRAPASEEAEQPLQAMVEAIKDGKIGEFLAVDRDGNIVQLART